MKCCFWASEESLEAIGTSPTFKLSPAKQVEFLGNMRYVNKDSLPVCQITCSYILLEKMTSPPKKSQKAKSAGQFVDSRNISVWLYRADQEDESLIKKVAWTC